MLDIMHNQTTKIVESRTVSCDGGNSAALGHPKVYLEIKQDVNEITCPYCGQHFVYKNSESA